TIPAALGESLVDGLDDVSARLLVALQLEQVADARFLEELVERPEAVVAFVEPGLAALERLLDHRSPDRFVFSALVDERLDRGEHQVEGLLLLVIAVAVLRRGRRGVRRLLARGLPARGLPARFLLAHQVVVIDEL